MYSRLIFSLALLCVFISQAYSQLPNNTLYDVSKIDSTKEQKLYLAFDYFGFNKNNEYFGKIADGYTLFGNHLQTTFVYYPTKTIRIETGVFLWKDFGNSTFTEVQPYFQLKYKHKNLDFIFGNLEGNLAHGLIEPLIDFERVMQRRLENGFQVRYKTARFESDVWVDWFTMIYKASPFQEEVHGGFRLKPYILKKNTLEISAPIEMTAVHTGGQIDKTDKPVTTTINGAVGLKIVTKQNKAFLHAIQLENYLALYTDYSFGFVPLYKNGHGIYSNISVDTKLGTWMLSYWNGFKFINPLGGALYSSKTKRVFPDILGEPRRQLLILRLINEFKLAKNLNLLLRTEPFYDIENKRFAFSTGLYLKYQIDFNLLTIKK